MRLGHLFRPLCYARSLFRLRLKHDQFCPLSPILGGHQDFAHLFDDFGFESGDRGHLVRIDRTLTAVTSGHIRDVAQNAVERPFRDGTVVEPIGHQMARCIPVSGPPAQFSGPS